MRITRYLVLPLLAALVVFAGASPANAATPPPPVTTVVDVRTVTETPLDLATGRPIGAPVVVSRTTTTNGLTASVSFSGTWGTPSDVGRHLFRLDVTHNIACFFSFCVGSYRTITDVDATWIRGYQYVHANSWAKYTPVGNSYVHYDKQSQTFGNDNTHYAQAVCWPYLCAMGSAFYYRGTAQNVLNIPGIGDAYMQDSNEMTIFMDGTMYVTARYQ